MSEGVNGMEEGKEKDKNAVQPLIIDGLEVDREVRSFLIHIHSHYPSQFILIISNFQL